MSCQRRALGVLTVLVCLAAPARGQTAIKAERIGLGGLLPSTSSPLVIDPADVPANIAGQSLLFLDGSGVARKGTLSKGDLPGVVGYTDEAETWALLQTFTSGLTSNGLVTIGGANDLLLGTGGMRAPSGSILLRNVADSASIATFGDSAIALNQPTTFTGIATFGTAGLRAASTPLLLRNAGNTATVLSVGDAAVAINQPTTITGNSSVTGTFGVSALATLTGGFSAGASSSVAGDLSLTGTGHLTVAGNAGTSTYVSQATGWRITPAGGGDFRHLFTDELHAKTFVADLEQALAGGQIISKSVAVVSQAFTCPAAAGTTTLWVRDLPSAANVRVFTAADWVVLRTFSRTDADLDGATDLTVGDCVGQVSAYTDGSGANEGTQSWTFTRGAGANAGGLSASTVIAADSLALDFGVSGNGYAEVNATDGAEGINAPYYQVATWTTAPVTANRSARARFGNLRGVTGATEYGLLAGTFAETDGRYLRLSDQNFELHGVDLTIWDGSTQAFLMRRNAGAPYFSMGNGAPTAYASGTGVWMGDDGGTYKFRVGDPAGNRLTWDGSTLTVAGNGAGLTSINGGNIQTGTITADQIAVGFGNTNLISNGQFESGLQGWACVEGSQCGAMVSNLYGNEGAGSMVLNPTAGNTVAAGYRAVPIEGGSTYYVRVWIYGSAASAAGLYVRMNEINTNAISPTHITSANRTSFTDLCGNCAVAPAWQELTYIYTAPASVRAASLSIYNWTSGYSLIYYHVDGVQLIKRTGSLSAISAELGQISINASTGYVRSGSTVPGSGTGVWLGVDAGTPKLYVGNGTGSTNKHLYWNGSTLSVQTDSLSVSGTTSLSGGVNVYGNTIAFVSTGTSYITNTVALGTLVLGASAAVELNSATSTFRPAGTGGTQTLGTTSNRWGNVYLSLPDYAGTHNFVLVGKTDGSTGYVAAYTGTCNPASASLWTVRNGLITACP